MPRKVTFQVDADTRSAKQGLKDAAQAVDKLHSALDRFGPVGSAIATVLGKLGFSSVAGAAALGAATAAIGAGVAIGEKAIDMYVALGDKVRNYANVTGESADQASRQVQAFEELGVSSEVAAAGMFKLAKAANTHAAALADLGIQIAHNADGTVDLNGTLLNTINAYQATGDAAQRDAIILAAFGRSGAAMIPILETNIAQLKRLQAQVGQVYTQKDLDQIRDYNIAQKQAQKSADEWGLTLGRTLLPAQKSVYDSLNENVYVSKHLDEELIKLTGSTNGTRAAMTEASTILRKQWQEAQTAAIQIDELAAAQQRAADAARTEAEAEQTLYEAINKNMDAHFAYRQAVIDLKRAQADAAKAKGKDAEANLRLEEAMFRVADAAVAQENAQRAANSEAALTTYQSAQLQIQSLMAVSAHVDKHSKLYQDILAYIALLKQIPADASTTITAVRGGSASHTRALASGGTVAPGETVMAGEAGAELVTGGANGATVTPLSKGGGTVVNVTIAGGMFMDHGPTIDEFAKAILRHARFRPGT